jgi:diadenosine tetraphosphatase ApaH/serine/threonine PP2A family protein phosphatase
MFAALACVHANLEALTAVLADVDAHAIRDVRFLGDVAGYGPSPVECADLLMARASVSLRGHADQALLTNTLVISLNAGKSIDWARTLLEPGLLSGATTRRRWAWLTALASEHRDGPDLFVHGSPREPIGEYVLLSEVEEHGATEKLEEIFAAFERLMFNGHTHMPGVITQDLQVWRPTDERPTWRLRGGKAIVNVGAVGQPRDGDPRACYAIVDGDTITWRRVPYDVERTMERIRVTPELVPSFAERLPRGI